MPPDQIDVNAPITPVAPAVEAVTPVAAEAAPVIEAPAAAPVTEVAAEAAVATEPTLFQKMDEEKAAEAEPPKPGEPGEPGAPEVQQIEPTADIKYEFQLPEVMAPNETRMGAFTELLKEVKATPEVGQKIIDLGAEMMSDYAKQVERNNIDAWNKTSREWLTATMSDPELGGSGHHTALAAIARMRDSFISSAPRGTEKYNSDLKDFLHFDQATHASNHPAFLRFLHNVAQRFDEPQAESLPIEIKPTKANGKPPRGSLYSHPTSQNIGK